MFWQNGERMNNLAQKWIDTIQNSLLGALLVRLWPILFLFQWAASEEDTPLHFDSLAGVWLCILVLAFLAWTIGLVAIYEKPKGRWALERHSDAPRNGFGVWSVPPVGGLKPPRLTKAVVMALGQASSQKTAWLHWVASTILFAAMALLLLGRFDPDLLASVSPFLVGHSVCVGLLWGVAAVMAAFISRAWAVDCRKRLEADRS